jgi:ADP-ribose pyrophosphatase YjhB (NUDIX family)
MPPGVAATAHSTLLAVFRRLPAGLRKRAIRILTPHFTVGAAVVIRRPNGSLLLVRQRHTGRWALPGGHLRRGEEAIDAAIREVAEEVAIRFDRAALTPAVPNAVIAPGPQRVDVIFTADVAADIPVTPDGVEALEARWFGLDELPHCQDGTRDALAACDVAAKRA